MTSLLLTFLISNQKPVGPDVLLRSFQSPPDAARPWVYWYFMEGNMTREGMTADLEAMRRAGLGGGIFLEVDLGLPRGPVRYMSDEWLDMVGHAAKEADRLGLSLAIGTGPGWCGTGGPWVHGDQAMQHLVSSAKELTGPSHFTGTLAQPRPRTPFFGEGTLTPELRREWDGFYRDVAVIAVPSGSESLSALDEKSLVYRAPFSSVPGVPATLTPDKKRKPSVLSSRVIDLSGKMNAEGQIDWDVPPGRWTVLRFGRTLTGQTTRPAPRAGLGFETDKFETAGIDHHLDTFVDAILGRTGKRHPGRGLVDLHFDSWEMGAQNWSPQFRDLFRQHRGYDPLPYLPVMAGQIVDSVDVSERFLWDLRQTAQELVVANHLGTIKRRAHENGLQLSVEPYDMNPTADLTLGAVADVPMGEFWSKGFGYDTEYSCFEAVSIAHTNGRSVVGAESFTADDRDGWIQHPASMKAQTDWALATGINRLTFHRYQHQPHPGELPGMTMGPYGVHWEATETWWDMVPAYHRYITRCQSLLRQGLPVADVLYLVPEGAPNVFQPPHTALMDGLPDRKGYSFDGCSPETLITRASAKEGQIVFPDGTRYRMLVLPRVPTMTPRLLRKIAELVKGGATVVGNLPTRSPSLQDYPTCDDQVVSTARSLGGRLIPDVYREVPVERPALLVSSWIWSAQGEVAPGRKVFTRSFETIPGRTITSARVLMTGDNHFRFSVNGHAALAGDDFHKVYSADITNYIKAGTNDLRIVGTNDGPNANPAGVIGAIEITYEGNGTYVVPTDFTWQVDGRPAAVIGGFGTGPWNLTEGAFPRPEMYPEYDVTAGILARKGVPPDVEAGGALRAIHRRLPDGDLYFVGNRSDDVFRGTATFRVAGKQPEWWDPMTGESRLLPQYTIHNGRTSVPLRLEGNGSGFVVFRKPADRRRGVNFIEPKPVQSLQGPWQVAFDPRRGGPASVRFDRLDSWAQHKEKGIRYYSGKATYQKTFDAPQGGTILSLGRVANIASVKLNGRDLGVAWCAPWQVRIPAGVLKPRENRLEVTVANLWVNRLIGDAALPPEKRTTKTTWSPYNAQSPLQTSGLLGPVSLMR